MHLYYIFTVLILIVTVFSFVNHKILKWPAPIAVMVFSLVASIILIAVKDYFPQLTSTIQHSIESIDFYEVFMKVFLGFILFAGAFHVSLDDLRKETKPVLVLALCSTLISLFVVGYLLYWLLGFLEVEIPLIHCFLFASLISPTDPVAVLGLLKRIGIPKSYQVKVTGESLFNDGIAIVLFTAIFAAAQSTSGEGISLGDIGISFLRQTGGGVVLGFVLAAIGFYALRAINDHKVEILITLVLVMVGYTIGEHIGVSAPIAIVIAGLVTGSKGKTHAMSEESNRYVSSFWELLDEFLNLLLFLLIGLEVLVFPMDWSFYVIGLAVIAVVLIARYISVLIPIALFRNWFEKKSAVILTWCGLRGGVSIALALSLPAEMHRDHFIIFTYIIAVFSIAVQGLTIKNLLRKVKVIE